MSKIFTFSDILLFTPDKFLNQFKNNEIGLFEPSEKVMDVVISNVRTRSKIIDFIVYDIVNVD